MNKYMSLIAYLLLAINIVTLVVFGVDKVLAKRKKRRVPELALLFLCFLWGSLGGLLAMVLFRHKTNFRRHPQFVVGVPVLLVLQLVTAFFVVYTYG